MDSGLPLTSRDPECTAIQQDILAALRRGGEFRTVHKEGGTTIRWRRGRFIREDYGDWSDRAEYTDHAEFLAFLWRFFEWRSRGFEQVELSDAGRWRNIRQLMDDSAGPGLDGAAGSVPGWMRTIGAFVIAAAAVTFLAWLRGGIHWRGLQPDSAPQKLDTFDGRPPRVTVPQTGFRNS